MLLTLDHRVSFSGYLDTCCYCCSSMTFCNAQALLLESLYSTNSIESIFYSYSYSVMLMLMLMHLENNFKVMTHHPQQKKPQRFNMQALSQMGDKPFISFWSNMKNCVENLNTLVEQWPAATLYILAPLFPTVLPSPSQCASLCVSSSLTVWVVVYAYNFVSSVLNTLRFKITIWLHWYYALVCTP